MNLVAATKVGGALVALALPAAAAADLPLAGGGEKQGALE